MAKSGSLDGGQDQIKVSMILWMLNGQRRKISWARTLLKATVTQVKWNGLMVNLDQILDWFQETDRIERIMDTFISTLPKASIWNAYFEFMIRNRAP